MQEDIQLNLVSYTAGVINLDKSETEDIANELEALKRQLVTIGQEMQS